MHPDVADEESQSVENAIDGSAHGHPHGLPDDLHPTTGERQGKKQNHMIHLHLIPHIYVPVLHPVRHPVTYALQPEQPAQDHGNYEAQSYQYEHGDPTNLSTEQGTDIQGVHNVYDDHSSEDNTYHDDHAPHPPVDAPPHTLVPDDVRHDLSNHVNIRVPDISHESEELFHHPIPSGHYHYPYQSEETVHHQYQVHEEPTREHYFGDYATGSSNKAQILLPNKTLNFGKTRGKHGMFLDRSQLSKKLLQFPINMRKLRVMRPPAPGQRETWLANLPHAETKLYPAKALFDFKPSFIKSPMFDFKPSFMPQIVQPIKPAFVPMVQPSVLGARSQSPVLVYPTNVARKREDKMLKT